MVSTGHAADNPGAVTNTPEPPPNAIIIITNANATRGFEPNRVTVRQMIETGLCRLTGTDKVEHAWTNFITGNDTLGIKVCTRPGPICGTRVELVAALVESILSTGLVPPTNIIVWDRDGRDLAMAGFIKLNERYGVVVDSARGAGFDTNVFYQSSILGALVWGDTEFDLARSDRGRNSYLTRLLTSRITKLIVVSPMVYHRQVGVTGCLWHLAMDSVDNTIRFANDPERLNVAVPEICAMPEIADRLVLAMYDALIWQYESGPLELPHYSKIMNQIWLSRDCVALDALAAASMNALRHRLGLPGFDPGGTLFANAALMQLGSTDTNHIQTLVLSGTGQTGRAGPGT